jgi:hypothetical protein
MRDGEVYLQPPAQTTLAITGASLALSGRLEAELALAACACSRCRSQPGVRETTAAAGPV